jgi:capsular polysaccharide biosynthesis protein
MAKLKTRTKTEDADATSAAVDRTTWRSRLPEFGPGAVAVVVVDADQTRLVADVVDLFPIADVHVVLPGPDVPRPDIDRVVWHSAPGNDALGPLLERIGTLDAFVFLRRVRVEAALATWGRSYLHLADGGTFVLASVDGTSGSATKALDRLATIRDGEIEGISREETEAARSTRDMTSTPDGIVFTKSGSHQLKVGERRADDVLPHRIPALGLVELDRLPATVVTAAGGAVVSHRSTAPQSVLAAEYEVPELPLRHYGSPVVLGQRLVTRVGQTLLPGSFKSPFKKEVTPEIGRNPTPNFAAVGESSPRRLEGVYYDLRCAWPGQYGHVLTDTVGKLWGWAEAKRAIPGLKAIYRLAPKTNEPGFERDLFRAFGIDDADVEWVTGDVEVESLVAATTMWEKDYPHYAHPGLRDVWATLRGALVVPGAPSTTKIFVTRPSDLEARHCRNAAEVDEHFARRGFAVVRPETMSLAEQATLFAGAEVIAGFGGAAMFNVLFSAAPRAVLLLDHESYLAKDEQLFGLLSGAQVHCFWSAADVPRVEGSWDPAASKSAWEFDFARNRGDLDELLATL